MLLMRQVRRLVLPRWHSMCSVPGSTKWWETLRLLCGTTCGLTGVVAGELSKLGLGSGGCGVCDRWLV